MNNEQFLLGFYTVTDNCHGNRCNHGRCINAVNAFTCICDLGYTGTLCDKGMFDKQVKSNETMQVMTAIAMPRMKRRKNLIPLNIVSLAV